MSRMRYSELREVIAQLIVGEAGDLTLSQIQAAIDDESLVLPSGLTLAQIQTAIDDETLALPAGGGLTPGAWVTVDTSSPLFPTATQEVIIPNSVLPDGVPIEVWTTFIRGANAEAGNYLQVSDHWSGDLWDKTDLLPSVAVSTTSRLRAIGLPDQNPGGGLHIQATGDMTGCSIGGGLKWRPLA
jgi:hypothetical protein